MPQTRDDKRDRELLGDLASGRREALSQLYDRHSASLFRHALALTRRQAEAEDLVQAVFVKLATTGAEPLALDELPPLQREVIVLHLIEGFSFLEVGRLTGVSLFTAAARYRLAVARLRKALDRATKDPT